MSGWIKLHRQIWDHWLYQEKRSFSRYEAWLDILLMANHSDNRVLLGSELIEVERGSFITSELKLMDRWGWSKKKLRTFLELLEKEGMIQKKSDRKKTTIKVLNYGLYQGSGDHGETTERPRRDYEETQTRMIKNDKNEKKDNISSSRNKPKVYSEDDKYYRMALYFYSRVMEVATLNNKEHLVRDANLQKWADEFRKIVELDKRDTKELKQIIDWATSDPFWQTNILSPSKLRKQYVNLAMQMSRRRRSDDRKNKVNDNLVFLRAQLEGGEMDEQTGSQLAIDQSIGSLPPFRS